MSSQRKTIWLLVWMNGQRVGTLQRDSSGRLGFAYDSEWLASEQSRPISLSIPLGTRMYSGMEVEYFFENLLPDSIPLRNRIQARFRAESNRSFDLLWHIGRDCVGALQLLPEEDAVNVRNVETKPLTTHEIATILRNYQTQPLGMNPKEDFRISIAGMQEKTALLWFNQKWQLPLGATPTSHIFKLPIGQLPYSPIDLSDSVENEWFCLQILKAYGFSAANAEIHTFEDLKVLVVERFDRRWARDHSWLMRLPQEDLCQAFGVPSAHKYESDGGPGITRIMDLLLGATDSWADRQTFFKLHLLFWLLAAVDGHAKNFSIFLLAGGGYRLTPVYDVMSAYPLLSKNQMSRQKLKMAMGLQGKSKCYRWNQVLHRHWLSTAKQSRFPVSAAESMIQETLQRMDAVLEQVITSTPPEFPEFIAESIVQGMRKSRDLLVRSRPTED